MIHTMIRKGWLYLFLWNFADILFMKHCVNSFNDWLVTSLRFLMMNANLAVLTRYIDVLVSYRSLYVAPRPICIFFYSFLSVNVKNSTFDFYVNCIASNRSVFLQVVDDLRKVNVCKFSGSHIIYLEYLVVNILIYKVK